MTDEGMDHESRVQNLSIEDEMKGSYLTYAMSVIISRALPDVRDGLKPSQRRILVAMNDLNLSPRGKHRKCAKIAGDTSGNYHPHGESVIYPTLVRMAQDFNMRYPLIHPQGNFGSVDSDPPAAMRYTEARMTMATTELLQDLEKNTVDFVRNYDETRDEPTVLPGKFPNLLVNGGSGIAVGMATNFAPHNLTEICHGLLKILEDPDINLPDLMQIIPGPDFPTGGGICGRAGILSAYRTGRGIIILRAKVHTEEIRGRINLVITEIPYQVSKAKLASDIAKGVREGRFIGISDIRDESGRDGKRLVIEVKKGENEDVVLNQLWKHTQLQTSFGIQNVALVNGRPRTLNLHQLLFAYRDHRIDVIRRRSRFLLEKAERRAHIVRGLLIALDHIDRVIALIRASRTADEARLALMGEFGLTRIQAQAILTMQLQRLTGLEREKLEEELAELQKEIDYHREVLTNREMVLGLIRDDVQDILDRFGDARRTEIMDSADDIAIEDLITEEQMVVTITGGGYVKRTALATYRSQGRGGKGVTAGSAREGDFIKSLFVASTHDYILFFTSRGKVYWLKVYDLPDMGRTAKGRAMINLLPLQGEEHVLSSIQVREFDERFLVFATRNGIIKKTKLEAYSRPKKNGIIAINIDEGDVLIGATLTSGDDDVVLSTANGMAIRFPESGFRELGRVSRGVKGITLTGGDEVVSMSVVIPNGSLFTVCERGFGKRTEFAEYRIQNRGGRGTKDIRTSARNGRVVVSLAVAGDEQAILATSGGMLVRMEVGSLRTIGRNTQGVTLIRVKDGDRVIAAELVQAEEEDDEGAVDGDGAPVDGAPVEGAPVEGTLAEGGAPTDGPQADSSAGAGDGATDSGEVDGDESDS